jgi:hypothetical protein
MKDKDTIKLEEIYTEVIAKFDTIAPSASDAAAIETEKLIGELERKLKNENGSVNQH